MFEVQESFYELAPYLLDIKVDSQGKRSYEGRRFVYFRTGLFSELFKSMKDVIGPVANRKIKEFGVNAGEDIAVGMDDAFKDTGPIEIAKLMAATRFDYKNILNIKPTDDLSQLHKIFGYGRYVGWIGPVKVLNYEAGREMKVEVENTFESYSYEKTGEKQCKFITGVLEGLLKYYWDEENLESEELRCKCESDENQSCQMEVTAE